MIATASHQIQATRQCRARHQILVSWPHHLCPIQPRPMNHPYLRMSMHRCRLQVARLTIQLRHPMMIFIQRHRQWMNHPIPVVRPCNQIQFMRMHRLAMMKFSARHPPLLIRMFHFQHQPLKPKILYLFVYTKGYSKPNKSLISAWFIRDMSLDGIFATTKIKIYFHPILSLAIHTWFCAKSNSLNRSMIIHYKLYIIIVISFVLHSEFFFTKPKYDTTKTDRF